MPSQQYQALNDRLEARDKAAPAEMLTQHQYAHAVAAFLMWLAEPHLNDQKAAGFRVLSFLLLFAVLMWFVKQRLWRNVEH